MKRRGLSFLKTADLIIPTAPIGIFFGRMGNFINGELYGRPTTRALGHGLSRRGERGEDIPRSSTRASWKGFSFSSSSGFTRNKKKRDGDVFALFLICYAVFRIFCEFFREPDAQVGYIFGLFTMGQLLSLAMLVLGLILKFLFLPRYAAESPSNGATGEDRRALRHRTRLCSSRLRAKGAHGHAARATRGLRVEGPGRLAARGLVSRSWRVAWPMTLIMLFEFLIGLTDVYVAGRVGKDVQAAYGFVIQLYFMFIIIANALTVGTVSVVSRLYTSGDKDELTAAIFSSLAATAAAGVLIASVGVVFTPLSDKAPQYPCPAQALLHTPHPHILGRPSLRIHAYELQRHPQVMRQDHGLPENDGPRLRHQHRPQHFLRLLYALELQGDRPRHGLAPLFGSLVSLSHVRRLMTGVRAFSKTAVRRIIDIGWPMGALQVLWQLGSIALFLIISELPEHKVEILAALTAGLRIESAIYLPAFAFNMANAVIVGNFLGEEKREEAYRSGLVTALVGVILVTLLVAVVILNARRIASLLSQNPVVVRESVRYLKIAMISEPFMAWGAILGGGLSGAGDTRNVLVRVAFSIWVVRIPLAYLFVVVLGFGAASVWWSMNISQFVQAFLLYRWYARRKWLDLERA